MVEGVEVDIIRMLFAALSFVDLDGGRAHNLWKNYAKLVESQTAQAVSMQRHRYSVPAQRAQ